MGFKFSLSTYMHQRSSGVLLHISSLMGPYGIGVFGKDALRFIDFLKEAGFKAWQVLPFSIPDSCNSPYKSVSAFAGNPLFIDPEQLAEMGRIKELHRRPTLYCGFRPAQGAAHRAF